MAYIGKGIENLSDRAVLDNITTSATATYNLLLNGVAYVPSSAESLTVSLNGIIQKPQSSYSVSGSTIVFDSALTSSDSIDFILAERAITLTTVGSGSVGTSQLVDGAVTYAKTDGSFGKISQVVQDTSMAVTSTTSSFPTFVDTGLSVNITLSSTSSKALIIVTEAVGSSGNDFIATQLYRDSTAIGNYHQYTPRAATSADLIQHGSYHYLDSPSTTSQITFSVKFCNGTSSATCYHGGRSGASSFCMINVMEVLA